MVLYVCIVLAHCTDFYVCLFVLFCDLVQSLELVILQGA